MKHRSACLGLSAVLLSLGCVSCSDDAAPPAGAAPVGDQDGGPDSEAGTDSDIPPEWETPEPSSENPTCIISADCPSGQHCDLGECIQQCNTETPCDNGLACSPRARCVSSAAQDIDPPPVTEHLGAVVVSPATVVITEQDQHLELKLSSTSPDKVRYRLVLNAPHLDTQALRGEFETATTLLLDVDTTVLQGQDSAGSVRVFTTLGNLVVDVPAHVGVTGKYHGAMRYDGDAIPLGDARINLDVIEKDGDVWVRVDPDASLLFPDSGYGETFGHGTFVASEGLDVTIQQRVVSTFGGKRNHFGRDLGRKIRFDLHIVEQGNLQGTFEETIYALSSQPVTLRGSVFLQYLPRHSDPGRAELRARA